MTSKTTNCFRWHFLALLLLLTAWAQPAEGHDLKLTEALVLLTPDGRFQVDLLADLDALALGVPPSTSSAETAGRLTNLDSEELTRYQLKLESFFARRVRILFDGEATRPVITFPELGTQLAASHGEPSVFGLIARFEGRVPDGAKQLSFRASRSLPQVHLTVLDQRLGHRELLEHGGESRAYSLDLQAEPQAFNLEIEPLGLSSATSTLEVARRYLVLGFWHILPEGTDHVLFVLALFLLSARLKPLLWQVTAFTIAHAVTLTLSTLDVVSLPSGLVEPLIALSIAWVAIENLFFNELKPWRPVLVFAFGLLHGLGFAGVLGELGLPEGERLNALLAFNFGIELGQLTVLALALGSIGLFRDRSWYRRRIVIPLSLMIATAGLWWLFERL